jgi:beta-glucosidase
MDYIGVDYYFHDRIIWMPPFKKNKNERVTDMGWEIYPRGIYNVLKYLSGYQKPLIVLENGLADAKDEKRADFIKDHLCYVRQAMDEGADVRGYFHWSLLDNFEWAEGFWPKFGLYEVDRNTFERRPRDSAKVYAKICETGKLGITN